jgi:hypothetical protein
VLPALVVRMHELLALLLRHLAVESHKGRFELLEDRLDEIEHAGPFAEEDDLPLWLGDELIEQLGEAFELAGVAGRLLIDELRAVRTHAGHEQGFLQTQQVHLADEFLAQHAADDSHVFTMHDFLLLGGHDAHDLRAARR